MSEQREPELNITEVPAAAKLFCDFVFAHYHESDKETDHAVRGLSHDDFKLTVMACMCVAETAAGLLEAFYPEMVRRGILIARVGRPR